MSDKIVVSEYNIHTYPQEGIKSINVRAVYTDDRYEFDRSLNIPVQHINEWLSEIWDIDVFVKKKRIDKIQEENTISVYTEVVEWDVLYNHMTSTDWKNFLAQYLKREDKNDRKKNKGNI